MVEILIVVVIVGLLAGLAGPHIFEGKRAAEVRITLAKCREYHDAVMIWRLVAGTQEYPESLEQLRAPLKVRVEPDAWGNPFRLTRDDGELRIRSDGPDGRAGTADDICYVPPDGP